MHLGDSALLSYISFGITTKRCSHIAELGAKLYSILQGQSGGLAGKYSFDRKRECAYKINVQRTVIDFFKSSGKLLYLNLYTAAGAVGRVINLCLTF